MLIKMGALQKLKEAPKKIVTRIKMKLPISYETYLQTYSQMYQVLSAQQEHLTMTRNDVQQLANLMKEQAQEKQKGKTPGNMYG